MYRKNQSSWIKHLDFALWDVLMLEVAFVLAFGLRFGLQNPLRELIYRQMAILLAVASIGVSSFTHGYHGILRRNALAELKACCLKQAIMMLVVFAWLFATQMGDLYSRWVVGGMNALAVLLTWAARCLWKNWLYRRRRKSQRLPNLLLVAPFSAAADYLHSFSSMRYREFNVCGVVSPDGEGVGESVCGVPVVTDAAGCIEYVQANVIDEVFLAIKDDDLSDRLANAMLQMGIVVHTHLHNPLSSGPNTAVETVGGYTVLTTGISTASMASLLAKRLLDIFGALVGLCLCAVVFLFVAPGILISSPGPIFFKQQRVGQHGRVFTIYKFRSMVVGAEQQQKALMQQNQMQGLMFKMDDDPRIFPFGRFIRRTSIDEMPQFWNVLKGDMSLVGTRPPTLNEYRQYDLHHHVRMAVKPGITGLWQVSGRNEITDFEEVVKLDLQYIENWSLLLDIKILFRTVWVVLCRQGSA